MPTEFKRDKPKTQPTFDNALLSRVEDGSEIGNVLCCPECGQYNMHQVIAKSEADQRISIEFWCESCDNRDNPYELVIREHTGSTMMYWNPKTLDK